MPSEQTIKERIEYLKKELENASIQYGGTMPGEQLANAHEERLEAELAYLKHLETTIEEQIKFHEKIASGLPASFTADCARSEVRFLESLLKEGK